MAQTFGQVIPVTGPLNGFPGAYTRMGADTIIAARTVSPTTATFLQFGAGAVLIQNANGGFWQSLADFLGTATNAQYLQAYFAGVAGRNVKTTQPYSAYSQTSVTVVNTTATASSGSTSLTVASATGIVIGQSVEGAGIQPNALVTAVSGTTITISLATTTALASGTAVAFISNVSGGAIGYYAPGEVGEVLERGSIAVVVTNGTPAAGAGVYIRTVANANIAGTSVGDFEASYDNIASPPTVTTTIGSTSMTVSSASALAVGQAVSGYMFAANTFITAISGTTITLSVAAVATTSAVSGAVFSNTALLGSSSDPWLVFRTGSIDPNLISEITIKNRHAA